jgi:F420H(2)-dependent quinone reductase
MRMRMLALAGFAAATVAGLIIYWRWFPRAGTGWANDVLAPFLVERGWSGTGRSEIGTLEHVGRTSGRRHLTPIHPVRTGDGFRVVVPLGERSQWAANVLAAGHCRLHLHDTVFDLDEPTLVTPVDVRELPGPVRRAATSLGFRYLRLHLFAESHGSLPPLDVTTETGGSPPMREPVTPVVAGSVAPNDTVGADSPAAVPTT